MLPAHRETLSAAGENSTAMPRQLIANTAAVATGHPLGAAAGLEILREGGNAIDAAVAATLALCVVIPGSVGLGGYGGSAVIYLARSRRVVAVDFDSRAPLAFRDGLVTADKDSSYYGARSVTVPGVVGGLDLILREFGTKSWGDASQPAIRLAEDGFEFDSENRRHLDRCAPHFDPQSLANLFLGGQAPEIGSCWRQLDLSRLLQRLADEGPEAFYEGEIVGTITDYLRDRGGILTEEDFRTCRPQIVEAVSASCGGHKLATPPPPSGGITSLGIVQTMERFLGDESIEPWSGRYFHLLSEAAKHCWKERQHYLGDPEFVDIPIERLVSDQAAEERARQIRGGGILRGQKSANQSPHTSNVIAGDAEGNVISLTATQGWMFGSHLVVDGLGLVLNHGMSRFDFSPGHPNAPAPGKRMQHNMAPMIALRNNRPAYAFGLPGGPRIVSVTAQLVLNAIAFGVSSAESIAAPRLHTDGDEPLLVSEYTPASVVAELGELGHEARREEDMGGPVNVLAVDSQTGKIDIASGEGSGAVAGI
jgi:gamma-glutamyltranspeptidase / glutathione hydrolase